LVTERRRRRLGRASRDHASRGNERLTIAMATTT
jgi:hypothetical protein